MYGVVNKIIGIVIAFVLLLIMLANVMVADQLQARRSITSEVTNFIDEVTDTGTLTEKNLQDLYLACNGYGPICVVNVYRYVRQVNPTPGHPGETYTTYALSTDIYHWNQGDLCKVVVDEAGYTGMSYFLYTTIGLVMQPVDFQLTGRVR